MQTETDSFLELMEEYLPFSSLEWGHVEMLHRINFPGDDQSRDSLKRKFQDLYRTKVPTSDPNIPNHIKRAKEIQKQRETRTNSLDCKDEDVLEVVTQEIDAEEKATEGNEKRMTTTNVMSLLIVLLKYL